MNTRTKLLTCGRLRAWLIRETSSRPMFSSSVLRSISGERRLVVLVMHVFVVCEQIGANAYDVLSRFGIQEQMEGREKDVVKRALKLLGTLGNAK